MNKTSFPDSDLLSNATLRAIEEEQASLYFKDADETVFTSLHDQHYSNLFNYGLKLSADEELVKDCIQELFIDLWENRNRLGDVKSIKFYLLKSLRYIILRKTSTITKRLQKLQLFGKPEFTITFSHEEFLTSEETTAGKNRQVANLLNKLPNRQKEIIYLKYYEELEYQEIANILSINYQSVINHIYKAFQVLRKK